MDTEANTKSGNYVNVPLTKEGPVRVQMRTDKYVLDIELTEDEARKLGTEINLLLKHRKITNRPPSSRYMYCHE